MNISVIIPSRNATNLAACVAAVRKHEPEVRIVVVDDGIEHRYQRVSEHSPWDDMPPIFRVDGVKPFIFARNINIGIRAAGECDGVILLNDDALLETPGGFTKMAMSCRHALNIGIIGATTNVTGAVEQQRRYGDGAAEMVPRSVLRMAFVCVYIPRRTIDTVGLLDERFNTYGWEDNDYIHRCRLAGLDVCVHDGCFVDHSKLTSTFRGKADGNRKPAEIESGRKIFEAKWGAGNKEL